MSDDPYGCCFPKARQCRATSKRTKRRCRGPAVTGWNVCRFHGAGGGAPEGERNGAYRHGGYTREAQQELKAIREMICESKELARRISATGR